jgi:hypothetical protein
MVLLLGVITVVLFLADFLDRFLISYENGGDKEKNIGDF